MLFTNLTQFVVLLLMLVIGWLFGLASHPGGKKWKQALRDEQAARAEDVASRDARIRELEAANAELIRDRPAVRTSAPVATTTGAAAAGAAATGEKRGWFDWGSGDDLTRLRGVDGTLAERLRAEGVKTFAEIANLSDQDEIALERRIELPAGFVQREQLREQARLLADGQDAEFAKRFG